MILFKDYWASWVIPHRPHCHRRWVDGLDFEVFPKKVQLLFERCVVRRRKVIVIGICIRQHQDVGNSACHCPWDHRARWLVCRLLSSACRTMWPRPPGRLESYWTSPDGSRVLLCTLHFPRRRYPAQPTITSTGRNGKPRSRQSPFQFIKALIDSPDDLLETFAPKQLAMKLANSTGRMA